MAIINKALITEQAGPSLFVALSTNFKKNLETEITDTCIC